MPQLALAGTFTIDGLRPTVEYLRDKLALSADLVLAPYNQVFQELLAPGRLLSSVSQGVIFVLVRLEDFVREQADSEKASALILATAAEMISAAQSFANRSKVPVVYLVFAPTRKIADLLQESLIEGTARLLDGLKAIPATTVVDSITIDKLCEGERLNPVGDALGHVPYSDEYMSAIALVIVRTAHSLLVPPHKVLVLDCDNTLWSGVVGEDGPLGISVPEALAEVQRFSVKVQALGGLLCLASKNAEQDVLDVFDKRPEMPLKMDHIAAHRINWKSKSGNLSSLAAELNLGLDSFVFIDDNPVECAQMRAELPEVVTLQLPPHERIGSFLQNLWLFDRAFTTEEDARRTAMYKENAARRLLEETSADVSQFMESLQMEIDIRAPVNGELARLSQLTQKTNQFNFTTKRRTEAELRALCNEGAELLAVHVKDRFGDYGLVGLTILLYEPTSVIVDSYILSCRVLGRGVEHAVLRRIGEKASERGLAQVVIPLITTTKNEPALAFIESVASDYGRRSPNENLYRIPVSRALQTEHKPGHDPAAIVSAARERSAQPAVKRDPSVANRSARYETVALELYNGAAVMSAVRTSVRTVRSLSNAAVPPSGATQVKLVEIWKEVLGLEDLGVDDDYSALGGTSLMAVRLFAAISREFDRTLPLTTILAAPTVRELACVIEKIADGPSESLVQLKAGGDAALYLVHEGNGEILLYTHLARRLPDTFSVFGVRPLAVSNVPLAHDSVESMATHYVNAILRGERHGPIFLGGLCAGGVIAFEMAHQLQSRGHAVDGVFLLDAASPQALLRARPSPRIWDRLGATWAQERGRYGAVTGAFAAASLILQKGARALLRRLRIRMRVDAESRRFDLFHRVLKDGAQWPADTPPFSAIEIYEKIERSHTPKRLAGVPVSLVHASAGEGNDRPLSELYGEPALGWEAYAEQLEVGQVRGGHASMFQEQNADYLAEFLIARMHSTRVLDCSEMQLP